MHPKGLHITVSCQQYLDLQWRKYHSQMISTFVVS